MQKFMDGLNRIEGVVAVLAYTTTCLLLLGEIVGREVFGGGIHGSLKIATLGSVIAALLGYSLAVYDNSHLRTTFSDSLLPFAWMGRATDAVAVAIYLVLGYYGVVFVKASIEFKDQVPSLYIPAWWIQTFLPYVFFSCALKHAWHFINPAAKPAPHEA